MITARPGFLTNRAPRPDFQPAYMAMHHFDLTALLLRDYSFLLMKRPGSGKDS